MAGQRQRPRLGRVGTTSERIQRLLHNDGTYMSQFEATQLFREIATELTEAVKSALVMTDLSPEMQTEIRHNIVDEMLRRVTTAMEQQTAWRLSRRQQGFRATEQLTHDPLTHEEQQ